MNRVRKFFYEKAERKLKKEVEEYGLRVFDEDKFNVRIVEASRKDMIYTGIAVVIVVVVLYNWVV